MKGFIVDATYDTKDEKTQIQLFGRLENGQSFALISDFKPYFFVETKNLKKVKKLLAKYDIEETNLKTFSGEIVTKISGNLPADINKLVSAIHKLEVSTYEADIKPHNRFTIDHNLLGSLDIDGDYQTAEKVDRVYINPEIKPADFTPKLKILSIDTESSESGDLFCIGLHSENFKKNFMITKEKLKDTVSCKDEEDCLQKFKEEIKKFDPDIITGWNFIDFDLVYLQEKFRKYKMPFDIGRTNDNIRLRIESDFFRSSSVDIPGRQILDGLNLIKDPFIKEAPSIKSARFDSYTLEDVSQAILGTGKLLKGKGRHVEIEELYKSNQQKLVDYNLLDCKLVYNILKETNIIELAIERLQLTGLTLDKLTATIIAFDSLYIREARKRGLVSPSTFFGKKEQKIIGGYVSSLNPGIYPNVLVLDFKSLYPSIIRTFNIDPASFLEKKEKGAIESPNHAYFKNTQGILPEIIKRLHEAREKAKKENKELANYAIKIIMNSFFGSLASASSRYFNFDMANSITNFGQFIIQLTAKEIEKSGYKVIYSDTDSVFIQTLLSKKESYALGQEIQEKINAFYKNYVKKNYQRESFLELQFDKLFLSLMIPKTRNVKEEAAAKKRYAGLIEKNGKEELVIVGLEAIRGDWTEAAGDFQREILMKVFHEESVDSFIKRFLKDLKAGKMDSKLVYRKSIRKNLTEYTKTTPPHVKAARKLDKLDSSIISYYITEDGPEPIQKLHHKLDYEHYIKKQIEPIANQVLGLFGKSLDDVLKSSKQSTLF